MKRSSTITRSAWSTHPRGHALTDQDIDRAMAVIRQHSNCRKRDTVLLLVLFSTTAKPLEIARLEVSDYLSEDGSVREESVLRANAAINGKGRPLFFASSKVVAAVDAYLEERVRRGQGTKESTQHRGLDPDSRLFLTGAAYAMPINARAIGRGRQYRAGPSSTSTAGYSHGPDSRVCQHFAHGERWQKNLPAEAAMLIRSGRCSVSRSAIRSAI